LLEGRVFAGGLVGKRGDGWEEGRQGAGRIPKPSRLEPQAINHTSGTLHPKP
jgi:hypothetical protein